MTGEFPSNRKQPLTYLTDAEDRRFCLPPCRLRPCGKPIAITALLALAALTAGLLLHKPLPRAALTIEPVGQPRFQTAGVKGVFLAVTNRSSVRVCGRLLVEADPDPNELGFAGFESVAPFTLAPGSGRRCTIWYSPRSRGLAVRCEYARVRNFAESKVRAFLAMLRVPGVTTNNVWYSVPVARIEQQ